MHRRVHLGVRVVLGEHHIHTRVAVQCFARGCLAAKLNSVPNALSLIALRAACLSFDSLPQEHTF